MKAEDTKLILRYLAEIGAQVREIDIELDELAERYNPIKGMAADGMPHGSATGDSTAALAVKLADRDECKNRENELRVRKAVLYADRAAIRAQFDRLNSRYKSILEGRYVYRQKSLQKSWKSIASKLGVKEITAQRWEKFALSIFGAMLDEMPMSEEVLLRAYDARE